MENKHLKKGFFGILCALLLLVLSVISGQCVLPAFADTTAQYSGVLTDLQKDSAFNVADYPVRTGNYSIDIIQVVESVDGELFAYVYQPNPYVKVVSMNMATKYDDLQAGDIKVYKLQLLDVSGALGKYLVKDFKVSSEVIRYYNIVSVSREWKKGVDPASGADYLINERAYKVAKCYGAKTENGVVSYSCRGIEVIEIKNPYHDFLRYYNGFKFFPDSCDAHYIAFSTDRQIDRLIEAEVYYETLPVLMNVPFPDEKKENQVKLSDIDEASNKADGWFVTRHTWKRIESVKEFIAHEELLPETEKALSDKQWVLRFAETNYSLFKGMNGLAHLESYTQVSNVTILRLEFETDGVVYNLGAVSDKVTGDDKPGNVQEDPISIIGEGSFWDWLAGLLGISAGAVKGIFFAVIALIALGILLPVLALVFPPVGAALKVVVSGLIKAISAMFYAVWWIISAPFRAIAWLFRKIRGE